MNMTNDLTPNAGALSIADRLALEPFASAAKLAQTAHQRAAHRTMHARFAAHLPDSDISAEDIARNTRLFKQEQAALEVAAKKEGAAHAVLEAAEWALVNASDDPDGTRTALDDWRSSHLLHPLSY